MTVPRILLADNLKTLLGLNFVLMTRLDGSILGGMEAGLSSVQRASAEFY